MNNQEIEQMLALHASHNLSPEDAERLCECCGRDEVMATADRRTATILRKRRIAATAAVALLVVCGIGVYTLTPQRQAPLSAEATLLPMPEPLPPTVLQPTVESTAAEPIAQATTVPHTPHRTATRRHTAQQPVVVCNNQCDADSVISDIWKFLSA